VFADLEPLNSPLESVHWKVSIISGLYRILFSAEALEEVKRFSAKVLEIRTNSY